MCEFICLHLESKSCSLIAYVSELHICPADGDQVPNVNIEIQCTLGSK